ncbi:HPP family protein [Rhizobium herbae]|jgi:CBS-domain-containing membrane protein|uniref:CBS-domain-containing membrane protein n=2 Tax=Rhizobium TaxID=379 RepID=A0A7W8U657_9HYPH|nr:MULTISPECIES: HPP family protein [Rhizobium]MBB5533545.1 CBS-domain-containing membrane protein [Rhizobium giardinii]MBW9063381.1 HPP family protein [Rhizobium herbae]
MRHHIKHFVRRHEPRGHAHHHAKSAAGAITAMVAVGLLSVYTGLPLLIAPFGASAVLLFGQPKSPLSQPANVIGGYLLAAATGSVASFFFPGLWLAGAIAVGVTIGLMLVLRVTHPPAGAVPIVAIASHFDPPVLFEVVSLGSVLLVTIAVLHHLIPPRQQYPLRVD